MINFVKGMWVAIFDVDEGWIVERIGNINRKQAYITGNIGKWFDFDDLERWQYSTHGIMAYLQNINERIDEIERHIDMPKY